MPESTETSYSFEKTPCATETGPKITIQSLKADDHDSREIVVEKEKPTSREVEPTTSTETLATDCSFANKDSKITSPQVSNDTTPLLAKEDARNEDDNVAKPHPRTIRTEAPSLESHLFDRDGRLDQDNQMRPPWPLLSSPKNSPKQSEANRGWSGSGFRRDQLKRQSRDAARYNPSPTNGWPQRSPLKSDHPHEHEEASFTLFTHSFDTMSETGNYLKEMGQQHDYASPSKPHASIHQGNPPRKIDITLHGHDSDSSVDISPIKLVGLGGPDHSRQRTHSGYHRTREGMPAATNYASRAGYGHYDHPYEQYQHGQHPVPYGWGQEEGYDVPASGNVRRSNPFFVLRSVHKAFNACSYLLPCLRERDICPVNLSHISNIRHYHENADPESTDILVAGRRVEAAIYAFGGYLKSKAASSKQATSIFRLRGHRKTPSQEFYEDCLHRRYFVSGNRISWELEENPPVHLEPKDLPNDSGRASRDGNANGNDDYGRGPHFIDDQASHQDGGKPSGGSSSGSVVSADNQQKMKYRCKLCGQLKQNHNCPYQTSLQRSIAVMIRPVVNAFTANEPGILTKDLSEMNNFVSYESDNKGSPTPGYPHSDSAGQPSHLQITHVTPETKTRVMHSPQSSLSTQSPNMSPANKAVSDGASGTTRKRSHINLSRGGTDRVVHMSKGGSGAPFASSLTLRPEHYRAVTPKPQGEPQPSSAYQYPHMPLTFTERKRLSDTLFFLSKEIPALTRDAAELLRAAREKGEWDLALAEVLTQVVIGLYCGEGDHRLDGLQHYLLGIGISC